MNDLPFTPFNPETPLQPEAPPAKPKRQSRKKKLATPKVTQNPEPAQPAPRQRRAAKAKPAQSVKVAIGILPALAGLKEDEISMLMSIIGNLEDVSKKARVRIVAALSKVFS